ncbi:MAG: DinB family protein [Pigmentiphaga sp.]
MMTPASAQLMARYNQWANDKLYRAASQLSEAEYRRPRGAFFGSIHGTFNHLLVADQIWMGRFSGVPFPVERLDHELYADATELATARAEVDTAILAWAGQLTPSALESELRYISFTTRQDKRSPLGRAVLHFFNHQTHHRGQVTAMLSQAGVDYGVIDLVGMEWPPS